MALSTDTNVNLFPNDASVIEGTAASAGTDLAPAHEANPPSTYLAQNSAGFDDSPAEIDVFSIPTIKSPHPPVKTLFDSEGRDHGEAIIGHIIGIERSFISRALTAGDVANPKTDVIYCSQQPAFSDTVDLGRKTQDKERMYRTIFGRLEAGLPDTQRFDRNGVTIAERKAAWAAEGKTVDLDKAQIMIRIAKDGSGEIVQVQIPHWSISRWGNFYGGFAQPRARMAGSDMATWFSNNLVKIGLDKPVGEGSKAFYPFKFELANR